MMAFTIPCDRPSFIVSVSNLYSIGAFSCAVVICRKRTTVNKMVNVNLIMNRNRPTKYHFKFNNDIYYPEKQQRSYFTTIRDCTTLNIGLICTLNKLRSLI